MDTPAHESDLRWMERALQLAHSAGGSVHPNPWVGCVLVREGSVVGEGFHERPGGPHAEVAAIRQAGDRARGATAYVTLEPCNHQGRTGPCTQALVAAGVAEVVWAVNDPNPLTAGQARVVLEAAGIRCRSGLLGNAAARLNAPFFTWMRERRPWVLLKTATSLDGRIATVSGESRWISGPESRQRVHEWRARLPVIMVGIGTVLQDDPALTARIEGAAQPARLVVDPRLETPPSARLLEPGAPAWLACREDMVDTPAARALAARGARLWPTPLREDGHLDLARLLAGVAAEGGTGVLLEGGGRLNASALAQGVVDHVLWFLAPKLIGGATAPAAIAGPGVPRLDLAHALHDWSVTPSGSDWCIEGALRSISPERSSA